MNRLQLWKVVSVVLLACGFASAQHITSFEYPGAGTSASQGTVALGINPQGAVVGYGPDGNFVVHSYVCVAGCNSPDTFTVFNAPGAGTTNNGPSCFLPDTCQGTYAFSINAFGVIAGFYVDSDNVNHGFVIAPPYRTFTTLNEPNAGTGSGQGTIAGNINLGGEIAGYYIDASGLSHGFVTAPPYRTFTSFDPTGSVSTLTAVASALNLEGAVTGVYFDASGGLHGYVRAANGTITEYNVRGAGTASGQGTDASGGIEAVYRKHHPVPTWEAHTTPGKDISVLACPRPSKESQPSPSPAPEQAGNIGIEICRDMDYPELSRRYAHQQVGLMLVPAWDQGIGVDADWHGHLALMRAVEDGFTMVRDAKVGLLTASDDRGRILAEEPTRTDGALVTMLVTVPVRYDSTLYQRWGDWFAWLDLAGLAGLLIAWLAGSRASVSRQSPGSELNQTVS